MRFLVRLLLQRPEVRTHGLLAGLALREECLGVRSYLRQVLAAGADCRADGAELLALRLLLGGQGGGAFVAVCVERVDALAVGVLAFCDAVNGYKVVAVVVSVLFFRSFHGSADGLDTCGADFHNSHVERAMAQNDS